VQGSTPSFYFSMMDYGPFRSAAGARLTTWYSARAARNAPTFSFPYRSFDLVPMEEGACETTLAMRDAGGVANFYRTARPRSGHPS